MLSGREVDGDAVTRHRVRRYVLENDAQQIARKVAGRVTVRRFSAEKSDRLMDDLLLTGASAAEPIGANLTGRSRVIEGYVDGDVAAFVRRHLLLADTEGNVAIYDGGTAFPGHVSQAAAAADLARSTDARAQAAGLDVLDRLRAKWLSECA
jgi:hypothetical protein